MTACSGHSHQHKFGDGKRLAAALTVIAFFMIVELIGGILSSSLALLADAAHMFTDSMALFLAISAHWFSKRPPDNDFHFGYRRTQVLAAFVNGITLSLLLVWIVVEAFKRFFFESVNVDAPLMLKVAIVGLIANGVAFIILHRDDLSDNVNIRGAVLHVITDLLGSVAAIIAALVIMGTGWNKIDPILSLVVAVLIGQSTFRLLRETGHVLMEGAPRTIGRRELESELCAVTPEIVDVHHIKIWQITPGEAQLTMHVRISNADQSERALREIKTLLHNKYGIGHSTVQLEIGDADCPDLGDRKHEKSESATTVAAASVQQTPPQGQVANDPALAAGYAQSK